MFIARVFAILLVMAMPLLGAKAGNDYPQTGDRVQIAGQWVSIDDACATFEQSQTVRNYLNQRARCGAIADDHVRLARWCEAHGLSDSAQAHLRFAHELDPAHPGARKGLGLRPYRGMLLSQQELDSVHSTAQARQQSLKQWRSTLTALDRRFASHSELVREQAHDDLMQITDPSVLPALEEILGRSNKEAATAAVDLTARFETVSALDSMVRQVCASPHSEVRQRIAEHLKQQSPYRFVPQLLSALQAPISASGRITSELGNVNIGLSFYREGPFADELVSYMAIYTRSLNIDLLTSGLSRRETRAQSDRIQSTVERYNQLAQVTNQRVADTLTLATGESLPAEQESWYRWWYDENEYYYPPDRPLFSRTERVAQEYAFLCSCFLAGTPVTTWTGLRPIESIELGDLVLAIDVETGELAFKPVLGTTRRPPSRLLTIRADDATIHVTRGHPLWVVGRGWQMAKQISVGDLIYSTTGDLTVTEISEWADADAFNLIVGNFKTYFVTPRRVLVHDNTMRHPTDKRLSPGVESVAPAAD